MIYLVGVGTPTLADLSIITDKAEFVEVIKGKTLQRVFIKLNISLDGKISGRAATRPVVGNWQWDDGYFCRSLFWGRRDLGYNCQEVSLAGKKIRFTSDKGEGDYADFTFK
jgi:hypothetical protein